MNAVPAAAGEAALALRWGAGLAGSLRLADGRALRVVFPGVPGGGSGPDFTGAILDIEGDLLRGAVELHLLASGWEAHGHHRDPAYAAVVLHAVARNDRRAVATAHGPRAIPLLVLPPEPPPGELPRAFVPPCAFAAARGLDVPAILARLGLQRLRAKAARAVPGVAAAGPGPTLAALLLEYLGGANRNAFASLARRLPLPALLADAEEALTADRALALAAILKGGLAGVAVRRVGLRPASAPGRRIEAAGRLFARLWPAASLPTWPEALAEPAGVRALRVEGVGAAMATELLVNAVYPVALASGAWPEDGLVARYASLPAPPVYGRLRRLEGWLGGPAAEPFAAAGALQGGLLLHDGSCTKGRCGRCPLSS